MFLSAKNVVRLILAGMVMVVLGIGCGGKPKISEDEQGKLNEAQMATEAAVEKLAKLRDERRKIEEGESVDGQQDAAADTAQVETEQEPQAEQQEAAPEQ